MPSFCFNNTTYTYDWWDGQLLQGNNASPIAFDVETELVGGPLHIPKLALAMAYDGVRLVLVHPDDLSAFLIRHKYQPFVGHNTQFDWWVCHEHTTGLPRRILFDLADRGDLHDTMILDQLVQLATNRYRHSGLSASVESKEGAKVYGANLGTLANEYVGMELDKTDPYRWRYAELLGFSKEQIDQAEEGFKTYALKDVIATWNVYREQRKHALALMVRAGFSSKPQKLYTIHHDAVRKYGPLTEAIQVRASISLAKLSRRGVLIDQDAYKRLDTRYREAIKKCLNIMEERDREIFKRYKKTGLYKTTKKSGLPQQDSKVLVRNLESVCVKHKLKPVLRGGKKPGISTSAKAWKSIAERTKDPFIAAWVEKEVHNGKLKLLASLSNEQVWSKYDLLKRTGRTGASSHKQQGKMVLPGLNIQQSSRDPDFRACFVPRKGNVFVAVDFSYIELRTLAASCLARFGYSNLAEVIKKHTAGEGLDPHQDMGRVILGVDAEEFLALPKEKQKNARQNAKACFHRDVECLTPDGWRKISELTNCDTAVAQYWPVSKKIEFVKPYSSTTRYRKPLVRLHNESVDLRVTEDHRMLGYGSTGEPVVCFPDRFPKLRGFWGAGIVTGGTRYGDITAKDVRQCVCIQADGSLQGNNVRFGFTKKRKIDRFRELFKGLITKEYINSQGATCFIVKRKSVWASLLDSRKIFDCTTMLSLPLSFRQAFADELRHWDGHSPKSGKRFDYFSTIEANIETAQAVCSTVGYKSSIVTGADCLHLSVKTRDYSRGGNVSTESLGLEEVVYCINVSSSFLLVRDGKKPVVVGNCNFGLPGGLGVDRSIAYASQNYGVIWDKQKAKEIKKLWTENYPEMIEWLADSTFLGLQWNLGIRAKELARWKGAQFQVRRVIEGSAGVSDEFRLGVWNWLYPLAVRAEAEGLIENSTILSIAAKEGSEELAAALLGVPALTLTGRIRAGCKYTESKNLPFQGLAADGAKEAIWRMFYKGYDLAIFAHDEIVAEVPEKRGGWMYGEMSDIMNTEMEKVLFGLVPSACEGVIEKYWKKG